MPVDVDKVVGGAEEGDAVAEGEEVKQKNLLKQGNTSLLTVKIR